LVTGKTQTNWAYSGPISRTKNKGASHYGLTHCIIWSQRAELNRRPTDYES